MINDVRNGLLRALNAELTNQEMPNSPYLGFGWLGTHTDVKALLQS